MVGDDEGEGVERARAVGLFRYQLIRDAADPVHSTKERGKLVRELAGRAHTDPFGRQVRISRQTLDCWIRTGAPAGSTPWCPTRASAPPNPGAKCWSWR